MKVYRWQVGLLLVLFLVGSTALAFNEPTGFRDILFGSREWQIREKYPRSHCYPVEGGSHDDVVCTIDMKIADAPIEVSFRLIGEPTERQMMSVLLVFRPNDYGLLRDAFIDRYGQPHARKTETVTTRAGAKLDNEVLTWSGVKTWTTISRYGSRIDEGFAFVTTQEYQRILKQREAERKEKAKKGL